ncbi:MAG: peptide-methionine (R)-S-oxide reductase MsrB [Nanoarchaeota archaeon]|nr:peptide-methionine (R)-S-oxide reductase MsrB [Nanoarchaeota archaeon]
MGKLVKSEKEWKKKLSSVEYGVLRGQGTERPFTSRLLEEKRTGDFLCVACGNKLFSSEAKFESGTGWPSFDKVKDGGAVVLGVREHGGHEVSCKKCGGHLGHAFSDGPLISTGKRYCINGVALKFSSKNK